VARYRADGTLDNTFGRTGSGVVNFNVGTGNMPGAYDVALQPGTGRVLVGGAGYDLSIVALDPATATGVPPASGPTATVDPPTTVLGGSREVTFSVRYSDDAGIDVATIDGNDVRVTGPGGFSALAQLVSVSPAAGSAPLVLATYRVTAPNGVFSDADNGTYTIAVEPNQVRDTDGVPVAAGPFANSLTIAIAPEGPNLAVGRVAFAGRHLVGGRRYRAVATFVLRNTGTERFAGPLTVSVLASNDRSADTAVDTLTTATLQISLRPGASRRYTVRLGGPGHSLSAGQFYAMVQARPERAVELDLTDNVGFTGRPFRVTLPKPNRRRPASH
jgi:hypothetical protein